MRVSLRGCRSTIVHFETSQGWYGHVFGIKQPNLFSEPEMPSLTKKKKNIHTKMTYAARPSASASHSAKGINLTIPRSAQSLSSLPAEEQSKCAPSPAASKACCNLFPRLWARNGQIAVGTNLGGVQNKLRNAWVVKNFAGQLERTLISTDLRNSKKPVRVRLASSPSFSPFSRFSLPCCFD